MKVVFSASIGGKAKDREQLITDSMPNFLRELGHEVEVLLYDPSAPEHKQSFDTLATQITSADAYIGEMSRASQTLGFQLSFALSNTKPSLYLYSEETNASPGAMLSNNPSRLLKIKMYNSATYQKVLASFMNFAVLQQQSVRTSFMSTIKIDDFIKTYSSTRGISKGEAIRQLLSDSIENLN